MNKKVRRALIMIKRNVSVYSTFIRRGMANVYKNIATVTKMHAHSDEVDAMT